MIEQEQTELERRLRVLLPGTYRVFDEEVQPTSMGSVGLKYGPDGKVPWDEMWGSFCDLAMAGGPPHRGTLLEPSSNSGTGPNSLSQEEVAAEICRGLGLVTGLYAESSPRYGWVRLYCTSAAMAAWLMRAIVMENVSARARGLALDLPAGPAFRVVKEIKNVITAVAKSCHYWQDHMEEGKHEEIAALLYRMELEQALLLPPMRSPAEAEIPSLGLSLAGELQRATGLGTIDHRYTDWMGLDCRTIPTAIWMMRATAVRNVLSRREETVLFFPMDPAQGAASHRLIQTVVEAHRLAASAGCWGDPDRQESAAREPLPPAATA